MTRGCAVGTTPLLSTERDGRGACLFSYSASISGSSPASSGHKHPPIDNPIPIDALILKFLLELHYDHEIFSVPLNRSILTTRWLSKTSTVSFSYFDLAISMDILLRRSSSESCALARSRIGHTLTATRSSLQYFGCTQRALCRSRTPRSPALIIPTAPTDTICPFSTSLATPVVIHTSTNALGRTQ